MQVSFESDFQKKILYVSMPSETILKDTADVEAWRKQWVEVLKSWHSPYKALIDCSHLHIENTSDEMTGALERMFEFLKRFFLRKVAGWGFQEEYGHKQLPFEIAVTQEEGLELIGVRERVARSLDDFRSVIHIDNHFEQQNVELAFLEPTILTKEKLAILKSKIQL